MNRFLPALLSLVLCAPAVSGRDIGDVSVIVENKTIPVHVSADDPALNGLALQAFNSHGRYRLSYGGSAAFDIHFSAAGANQVRVDVTKGFDHEPVVSEIVPGSSERDALLRAADLAVERTNGQGLRGFFASKLVFISERTGHKEVYVGDLFFGGVRQITNDRAIAMTPRWSPDGRKIIYTSFYHSGFPDIFVIDLGTYERTTFASFRGSNGGGRFSPDGRRAAMVLSGEGVTEIYTSDAYGHGIRRLTRYDSIKSSPCWSPDGSQIAFASGNPDPQVFVIASSGFGSMRRVTHGISYYCAEPDWSRANPDKLAVTAWLGGGYQIAEVSLSSGEWKQVSHASFDGIEPCWLPDGRHLVYTARNRTQSVICILDTETGRSTRVSPLGLGLVEQANVWSPRGE